MNVTGKIVQKRIESDIVFRYFDVNKPQYMYVSFIRLRFLLILFPIHSIDTKMCARLIARRRGTLNIKFLPLSYTLIISFLFVKVIKIISPDSILKLEYSAYVFLIIIILLEH